MKTFDYTTADIIKLENAGGILTFGTPIAELADKPIQTWFTALPNVDTALVTAWYNVYIANVAMKQTIQLINKG